MRKPPPALAVGAFDVLIAHYNTVVTGRICALLFALVLLGALPSASAETAAEVFARGVQLQQQGDLEGARKAYEKALELAPGRIDIISNLALVYLNLGQPEKAIPGLEKARAAAPQHAALPFFLGLAYFQADRPSGAEKVLAGVVTSQPANTKARHLYGLCLLKLNKLDIGIAELEKVITADRSNRSAAYTLGSAYIKAGRIDQADRLIDQILSADESPQARLISGSVQLAKKDYQGALETLRQAEKGNARLPTLHSQLGVALLHVGYSDRARAEFEAELAISPADYNANAFLGWLYHQDGTLDRAATLLEKAYELNQADLGVQYLMAQVHQSRRQWEPASKLLEKVVSGQPEFIPAHVMLARIYAKLKRLEDFQREQRIIKQLNAKQQEKDLQGVDQLYDGRVLSMPSAGGGSRAAGPE